MAMQTIPSRLTIWTSFNGLPTASPFFRAKRNDAARRSDGTRKFQSPWGGTLGQPHGLFNFPALVRTPLADLLAHAWTFLVIILPERHSLINWRISYAVAAACLWLPPAAPLVLCHLQLRCTCAQCPSLLMRESFRHLRLPEGFSLFCLHPFSGFAPLW